MFCWVCDGNSGCDDGVGNVGGWRSDSIGWTGSVISGIAVLTSSWKPDVSSWMVCPAGVPDSDPGSGAQVWISIRWAAGSEKKLSGCSKRRTIGRSPGKSLGTTGRSQRLPRVPPGDPSMPSHVGAVVECQLQSHSQNSHSQHRLLPRSSVPISRIGRRMTVSGFSAGHGRRRRYPGSSPKPLRIRLARDEHCRGPAAAGPTNGWREANVG